MTVSVAEAQARLPELLAALRPGETLTLTQDDRRVADVVAAAPPGPRGPDLTLGEALAAARALGPSPPSPIRDEYLREARAGGMYGDLD